MDIFDAHAHIGESLISGGRTPEDELLAAFDKAGVNGALILPYPITADACAAHDEVADFCARRGPSFVGGACLNPAMPESEYVAEMERCVRDLGFRAIKFHPMCFSMSPLYARALIVFETAHRARRAVRAALAGDSARAGVSQPAHHPGARRLSNVCG